MPTPAYDETNIFAKILRGEVPCLKVYEDDVALAFMDIMPQADGHVLVLPKSPARNILDADPQMLGQLIARVQNIARAVKEALAADGITILQYNEPAGGQTVFHLHFHIVPRWTAWFCGHTQAWPSGQKCWRPFAEKSWRHSNRSD